MFWQIHHTEESGYITYSRAKYSPILPPLASEIANFNWDNRHELTRSKPDSKNLAEKSNTWGFNDGRLWVFECKQITNAEKKLSWLRCIITEAPSLINSVIPVEVTGTTTCRCLCTITKIVTALLCIQGRVHLKAWLIINGHRLKSLTLSAQTASTWRGPLNLYAHHYHRVPVWQRSPVTSENVSAFFGWMWHHP